MYRTVITFKDGLSDEVLTSLGKEAANAFDSPRLGKAVNVSAVPEQLIFEGEEPLHNCLQMGILDLGDEGNFKDYVKAWQWIDTDSPRENHCVLEAFEEIAEMRARY